tara:strand:- start:59 stop:1189 length:1131 start_codon:yes stop_codon:yes gene_type:complete
MKIIKNKIEELKKINLESFDIDTLVAMQSEIKDKQNNLLDEIEKVSQSIKRAKVYKEFYGETKLLPKNFTTPLRRIVSKQREVREIQKFYSRYEEEDLRLEKIIQRKILNQKQNTITGIASFSKIKDNILAFLICFVLGLLLFETINEKLSKNILKNIFLMDAICCLFFQLNFWIELSIAKSKKWYIKNHWLDFVTSIPIPSYELARTGRAIRLFRLLRFFRFLRIFKIFKLISFLWKGMHTLSELFDVRLMKKTFIFSFILLIMGAFTITYVEHKNNVGGIDNYKESLWWSFNAIVTGGFADIHNPQTTEGMVLTTILVFVGMVLISVFTATLTTLMVGDDSNQATDNLKLYVEMRLNKIEKRLDKIVKHYESIE